MLGSIKILLPVLLGCFAFPCQADEIHPHRDSVKKFNIREINKADLDSSTKNGERKIFTYNLHGDVIKEIFCLVQHDTVTHSDTLWYKYTYDHIGRPVCRTQVGVRRNTIENDLGMNPLRTDSIFTCWYYNPKGWTDSVTSIFYSSFQWETGQELSRPMLTATIYTYEPCKDLTILREKKVIREWYANKYNERVISHDYAYLQLFKDNPQQMVKSVSGCKSGSGFPGIVNLRYIQKSHLTYVYREDRAGTGCEPEEVLKNDTISPVFSNKANTIVNITDPLGNFVQTDKAVFNTLGLLIQQYHDYKHYFIEYTFFKD